MRPASAKAKGRRLQQEVRDRILATFPELEPDDVTSRSMGAGGEDLLLSPAARRKVPFSIECKNQESLSIWKALKQAEEHDGGRYPPLLIFRRNNSDTYAALKWSDLLTLLYRYDQ